MIEKNCKLCFHYDVCYAVGRMPERAETCTKYAPDVKDVKHGKWSRGKDMSEYAHCSACNRKMNFCCYGYAHCPLCGARMDGDE